MLRVVHISIGDCIKSVFVISTAGRNLSPGVENDVLSIYELTDTIAEEVPHVRPFEMGDN
jgi:hypothetical protein